MCACLPFVGRLFKEPGVRDPSDFVPKWMRDAQEIALERTRDFDLIPIDPYSEKILVPEMQPITENSWGGWTYREMTREEYEKEFGAEAMT